MGFFKEIAIRRKIKAGIVRTELVKVDLDQGTERIGNNVRKLNEFEMMAYKSIEDAIDAEPEVMQFNLEWHRVAVYAVFDSGSDTSIRFAWALHMSKNINWTQHHIVRLDSGFKFWSSLHVKQIENASDLAAFILAKPECWRPQY